MEPARRRADRDAAGALVVLAASLFAFVQASGFIGVSDDDASRALIAWDFTRHPSLDPTRSSWLPLPTYLFGALYALTRELWWTPRVGSLLALAACAWAGYALARRCKASPLPSFAGAALACVYPWSAFCGSGPALAELPGCAFALLGCWLLEDPRERDRDAALAGLAWACACLCRYELWFAAAGVFAALALGGRAGRRRAAVFAALAAAAPLGWGLVNYLRSGSPFDFVHRVVGYRAAVEPGAAPWASGVARYPLLLLATGAGPFALASTFGMRRARTASVAAFAALAGMAVTELRGGGATHHAARSLLPVVWLLVPAVAAALARTDRAGFAARVLGCAALVWHAAGVAKPPHDVDAAAVSAGRSVHFALPNGACWGVELGRYDALWVELASGAPERARPDRAFGAARPRDGAWEALARDCPVAAVYSPERADSLRRQGFAPRRRVGRWVVLAR